MNKQDHLTKLKVAVIGDNCIDWYIEPINKKFVGGCAVNVAIYMVRQGIDVSYIGMIGDDAESNVILESLEKEGVEINKILRKTGTTGVTKVKLSKGRKKIIFEELGIQEEFATNFIFNDGLLNYLSKFDLIFYTGFSSWRNIPENKKKRINEIAKINLNEIKHISAKVSFDYAELDDEDFIEDTINLVDYAFFSNDRLSEKEAIAYCNKLKAKSNSSIVITRGSKGVLSCEGKILSFPALDIEVVDTLGAGDSFIGTFLVKRLSSYNLENSIKSALEISAQTCLKFGGWGQSII